MLQPFAIGVFASTARGDDALGASLEAVVRLGVSTVQLGAPRNDADRTRSDKYKSIFAQSGIDVTVVFCGFDGANYETLELVEQTVGLTPPETRNARLRETFAMADFAKALECDAIGMHLGVLSTERESSQYREMIDVTRQVCDHCAGNGQFFHLETGQETVDELLQFIDDVERENLAVNFDPANMILYGKGDPIDAVNKVGNRVRSVHCKDATIERLPEQKWYEDCPLGTGDVGIETFVKSLKSIGYTGPLTIEREYAADQEGDLAASIKLLEAIRERVLAN